MPLKITVPYSQKDNAKLKDAFWNNTSSKFNLKINAPTSWSSNEGQTLNSLKGKIGSLYENYVTLS